MEKKLRRNVRRYSPRVALAALLSGFFAVGLDHWKDKLEERTTKTMS